MAFYLTDSGAVDLVAAWTTVIGDAERAAAVSYAHSKGAIVLMSVGGATDSSWPAKNATAVGQAVGELAISMRLDGVDLDLEVSCLRLISVIPSLWITTGPFPLASYLPFVSCTICSIWEGGASLAH